MSYRINKNKEFLNRKCRNVPVKKLSIVVTALRSYLYVNKNAIGIAANQLGMPYRAFGIRCEDGDIRIFINPEFIKTSGEETVEKERCLSLKKRSKVKRFFNISFDSQLYDGWNKTMEHNEFGGYEARVVQHELDHLEGVLICDREKYGTNI